MEEIKRQVKRARWRLILEQFLGVAVWSLFAALLVAAIGLAVPKIWVLRLDQQIWLASWIGGGVALGLLVAVAYTFAKRRSPQDAAIEIDLRYGLKERVSSTLALSHDELNTEIGQALMSDAIRRVERIDVREKFRLTPTWRLLLPFAPALVIAGLLFIPDAAVKQATAATERQQVEKKAVKKAAEKLQQRIRENQKRAEEEGLKDLDVLKEINKEIDKLAGKDPADQKQALIKLNDLSKEIDKRKQELGGAEKLKKQLDKLGKIEKGPADRLAEAMKEGDFGKAKDELEKLKDDLKNGKLNDEDKEKLAKQLEQVEEKVQQMKQDAAAARQQLAQEIEKQMAQGNLGEAAKMQEQLNEMERQAKQMDQMMDQLANKMGQAAKALRNGENQQEALDQLAGDLEQLEEQLERLENLDELQEELADAKDAMRCQECQGAGCKLCQGMGQKQGRGKGDKPGMGLGEGQGQGDRPEEEGDTKFYDSKVAGDPKAGESVRIGDAGGKNIAGKTVVEVREEVRDALTKREADPILEQALPRDQRENARQFFERFNKGE